MITDSVADALIRIKNGYMAKRPEVSVRHSKLVLAICKILEKEGYVGKLAENDKREITITLKYTNRKPALMDVKRVSKPGLRIYKGAKMLPWVLNGLGLAIISTPKGVMTDKQARKEGVGGEVMAYVW